MANNGTKVADLKPDPQNPRKHNPRNAGMVRDSLQKFGAWRSIAIDEDDVVYAGNQVLDGAAEAGIERVKIVETDGNEIVAVRRRGLTPEQKRLYSIADNRTNELSEWDTEALADIGEDLDLGEFFTGTELAILDQRFVGEGDDPYAEWQGMPEFEQEDAFAKVIRVYFPTIADMISFAEMIGQEMTDKTSFIWYPKQERIDMKAHIADES